MAYYITVESKKGKYTPLNITNSILFTRISNLKGTGSTLEEIDLFTMMFNDISELKERLIKEKILDYRAINKNLSIRRLHKGSYLKVTYDFLYQHDIEYVMDPSKIIARVNNKLLSKDFRFISKLANHYLEYYECSSTAPEVREFANNSIRLNQIDNHFYEEDENDHDILTRMLKLLIYEYRELPNGKVEYSDKVKYRNIHSLIAFINNYDKKYQEELPEESIFIKPKSKTKRKEYPGQISLFD